MISCCWYHFASSPWGHTHSHGNDSYNGSITTPFGTIEKAVSVVQPGQTIYIRGGTYNLLNTITISRNGSATALISMYAYPGEIPVLNFSGQVLDGNNRGILHKGSYWHFRGIRITGAGDNGMRIEGGSHNIVEHCSFYRNRDSGLQLDNGASDNTVRNCDSYFNADPPDYADADGFAPKLTVGSGNYFYGCRAWRNCDDGWDGYMRGADDPSTVLENCWAFDNGYLEDGTDPGASANGNGFKMGGSDDKTLKHNFTLKRCLAFKNKAKGFDQNNNKGSMILYNCTGHGNLMANYRITQELAAGKILVVKNCAELGGTAEIGSFADQARNSWMTPFIVAAGDFISLDATAAYGPRKSDGTLPDISYMHLAAGSDLIDGGVDVGLPYAGLAPDLGYFETGLTSISEINTSLKVNLYPNPAGERVVLRFSLPGEGRCMIRLFNITGRYIKTLADHDAEPGEQSLSLDLSDLAEGLYLYQIKLDDLQVAVGRFVKKD
ncbi:MAG: right-handed parallel beta-helix repeat-containing protein [Bacteroidales bacterium]|nr:right-handed parallel beta-helix repeat-containing protein [Bacteroidales bacterium]